MLFSICIQLLTAALRQHQQELRTFMVGRIYCIGGGIEHDMIQLSVQRRRIFRNFLIDPGI